MDKGYTYRCNLKCPIRKNCFIIKMKNPLIVSLTVLHKCAAKKADVEITIGPVRPP